MGTQSKTTRAFRTISEAAEELDLQPHVLRFWESKFPSFNPIKRGGGRRFYRPEDIEFLRGIKVLLHDERHPIKDVQKLIRAKGVARVVELGRSVKKAAIPKDVKDTVLVPDNVRGTPSRSIRVEKDDNEVGFDDDSFFPQNVADQNDIPAEAQTGYSEGHAEPEYVADRVKPVRSTVHSIEAVPTGLTDAERNELELALTRLRDLRRQWGEFKQDKPPQ